MALFKARTEMLDSEPKVVTDFRKEMSRFLPVELVTQTVNQAAFWTFLVGHIRDLYALTEKALNGDDSSGVFKM
jgi:hypothetical protein